VVSVERKSAFRDAGIFPGDGLLQLNGKPLATPKDLEDGIAAARKGGKANVVLQVACGDSRRCSDSTLLRPLDIKPE
jgi:S1-C subfamily serine protease